MDRRGVAVGGSLDDSADRGDLPPGHHAEVALRQLPARQHVTFGGRLTSDAHGWLGIMARQLAREGHAGDFRNPVRVRAWARSVAAEIRDGSANSASRSTR